MSDINPKVNFFFEKAGKWQDSVEKLRQICLDSNLQEVLKWGCPCYTLSDDRNIVLIHTFKEYCALLFFKGVLMNDPQNILIQQTEHVQVGRQVRFSSIHEILDLEPVIKEYIQNAIEVEKAGLKVELKKTSEFAMPHELETKLNTIPELKKAFEALTPGRQRGYLLYFGQAKQAKTREARIEKYIPQILAGKGVDD